MKSLIFFAIALMTIACTNVEKIYFSCNEDYTDCTQLENDPRLDNTLDSKDAESLTENGDNENVAVNDDSDVVNEEDLEPDLDSFLDEENPEELLPEDDVENTDDNPVVPDEDVYVPPEPCKEIIFLDGVYWENIKNSTDVKKTSPVQQSQELCCTDVSTKNGHYDSFCGNTFPQISPTSGKTLDYNSAEDRLSENNNITIETYKRRDTR